MMISPIDLILFLVSLLSLPIPLLIYLRDRKNPANISFALFALGGSLWAFDIAMFRTSTGIEWAWFWDKAIYIVGNLPAAAFLYFSFMFPRPEKPLTLLTKIGIILPALVFSYFTLFTKGLFIKDITLTSDGNHATLGPIYLVWMIWFGIFMALALLNLIGKYKITTGVARTQLKFIFFSLIFPMTCAFPFNLILPFFGEYRLIWIGPLSILGMVAIIFYAIIRHRFMDIRLALRAGLVRLILILVMVGVFVGITEFLRLTLGVTNWQKGILTAFIFGLFTAIFYEPILKGIRVVTDRVLFQREYSAEELLRELSKIMSKSLDLEGLLNNIKQTLLKVMRISSVGFVLKGNSKSKDNLLVEQLQINPRILVSDELKKEMSEKPQNFDSPKLEKVIEKMEEIKAAVVVPLPSSEGIEGMMILGEKKGGDAFNSSDIATLETLMYQAGIAIENASLFAQISEFNKKLKTEIDKATKDLSEKNQNLTVLRRLDEIIINTLDLDEICQKIVDTIAWEAGFLGGFLALFDDQGEKMVVKAFSQTPAFKTIFKSLSVPFNSLVLNFHEDAASGIAKALKERQPIAVDSFVNLFSSSLTTDLANQLQKQSKIKNLVIYPLSSKGKLLGAVIFALHKPFENLTPGELNTLTVFTDEAGIAIENAKLYQDLKVANEHLLELDKMKDELVSVASHELRTPMTSIKSYLWMIINKKATLTEEKKSEYLSRVYESSERMIKLVEDMLTVSKIEGGKIEIHLASANLKDLIEQVVKDMLVQSQAKGVDLTFLKSPQKLPPVLMDTDRTREILVNLTGNALKYTPNQGRVEISVKEQKDGVKVSIHDSGKGIAKEDIPRLFQKFGRLEGSFVSSAEAGGTGLGLYITKGLVELQGGKIWAESEKGQGSTFNFILKKG